MPPRFGFVGYGVVGSVFGRLLRERGAAVIAYDILLDSPATAPAAREKILAGGAEAGTLEEVASGTEYVLSVTPAQACREAARRVRNHLRAGQVYCDLASTSPAVKREIAAEVSATGAQFVEGVILGAVRAAAAPPEILLGGEAAASTADVLQGYGLRARCYSREVGPASAFKLIRSVFSKGMETLLIETLVAARRAGIFEEVWREILATLAHEGAERVLETWIRSHAVSSERRYFEMCEVRGFMEELGVQPLLTGAAVDLFRRSNEAGMRDHFEREPDRFADVIAFLDGALPERAG